MGKVAEWKYKILEKVFKADEKSYLIFEKYYPKVKNFVWTVGVFMGALYVFFKILDRIGFQKTVMILMISIAVYLRSWLKIVAHYESEK